MTKKDYVLQIIVHIYLAERKISEKMDKPDTDNGFSNDISSLFKKDFSRMTGFPKVQHQRKKTCHSEGVFFK